MTESKNVRTAVNVHFGAFEVDLEGRRLLERGMPIILREQSFQVLAALPAPRLPHALDRWDRRRPLRILEAHAKILLQHFEQDFFPERFAQVTVATRLQRRGVLVLEAAGRHCDDGSGFTLPIVVYGSQYRR
jgi:hypothetical protein